MSSLSDENIARATGAGSPDPLDGDPWALYAVLRALRDGLESGVIPGGTQDLTAINQAIAGLESGKADVASVQAAMSAATAAATQAAAAQASASSASASALTAQSDAAAAQETADDALAAAGSAQAAAATASSAAAAAQATAAQKVDSSNVSTYGLTLASSSNAAAARTALELGSAALQPASAFLAAASGTPVTDTLDTVSGTDTTVVWRSGVPYEVTLSKIATYITGVQPADTEPSALLDAGWSVTATGTPGEVSINIITLPADGGDPITALQYRVGGGAAIALTGVGTGVRTVSAGFAPGASASVEVRAVNGVGAGPWSVAKSVTPAAAPSGGSVAYINDSYSAVTAASTTITRPVGAGAGHTLVAILFSAQNADVATRAAPAGWTAGAGISVDGKSGRYYTAPGDVATLDFNTTTSDGILCFAVSGTLRAGPAWSGMYWENNGGADAPTPTIDAQAGDCVVSAYIQLDNGAGGVMPGPVQSGYTQQFILNVEASPPYISVASRESVPAGATGPISHGANGNFSTRLLFTGAFA